MSDLYCKQCGIELAGTHSPASCEGSNAGTPGDIELDDNHNSCSSEELKDSAAEIIERHVAAYQNSQWRDPVTDIPEDDRHVILLWESRFRDAIGGDNPFRFGRYSHSLKEWIPEGCNGTENNSFLKYIKAWRHLELPAPTSKPDYSWLDNDIADQAANYKAAGLTLADVSQAAEFTEEMEIKDTEPIGPRCVDCNQLLYDTFRTGVFFHAESCTKGSK